VDWQATKINEDKIFLRMAALYHYGMDVASLQRYCGWCHAGDHRRWQETLFCLKFIINEEQYAELAHGFEHGIPQESHSNKKNTLDQNSKLHPQWKPEKHSQQSSLS
jgi:hypothetical protein